MSHSQEAEPEVSTDLFHQDSLSSVGDNQQYEPNWDYQLPEAAGVFLDTLLRQGWLFKRLRQLGRSPAELLKPGLKLDEVAQRLELIIGSRGVLRIAKEASLRLEDAPYSDDMGLVMDELTFLQDRCDQKIRREKTALQIDRARQRIPPARSSI